MRERVSGQSALVAMEVSEAIETAAQRYAGLLRPRPEAVEATSSKASVAGPTWVDAESLELLDPRTVGVESLAFCPATTQCAATIATSMARRFGARTSN